MDKRESISNQTVVCSTGKIISWNTYIRWIYTSAILYNKFYRCGLEGVLVMDWKKFSLVPGSEMLGRVSGLIPYSGKILIATVTAAFLSYDSETVAKFNSVTIALYSTIVCLLLLLTSLCWH